MSHSPFSGRRGIRLAIAVGIATFGLSSIAWADPLQVTLVEDAYGATIQVRGSDDAVAEPRRVITSNEGAIFFFPHEDADVARLHTDGKHRLEYVQVGRSRSRAALRIKQSSSASGDLLAFLKHEAVPGGYDIRIEDRSVRAAAPAPKEVANTADPEARLETIAALERSLAEATPLPAPDVPTEVEPEFRDASLAPVAPAAQDVEEPVVSAPEPTPASSAPRSPWPYLTLLGLALATGGAWWFRRRRFIAPEHGMEIVSRISLAPRQQILWVRAGGKQFLIGATDQRISLLTEFGKATEDAALAGIPQAAASAPAKAAAAQGEEKVAAFKARLQRALGEELKDTHRYGEPSNRPAHPDADMPEHLRRLAENAFWPSNEDAA